MKLRKRTVALITTLVVAFFLLGTAIVAAPKTPKGHLPKPDYDSGWVNANFWELVISSFTSTIG